MKYFVEVEGDVLEVESDGDRVRVDGEVVDARLLGPVGSGRRMLRLGRATHAVTPGAVSGDRRVVHVDGRPVPVVLVDERTRRVREMSGGGAGATGPRSLTASMPGLVVKVEVEAGQTVTAGQGLIIVEAMKMENELKAETDAVVSRVRVEPGQAVDKDDVLVEFEAPDGEDGPEGSEPA